MRKAISLKVSLWIEGEDEPAHNFAASTKQAVRDIIAAGSSSHPELKVKVRSISERGGGGGSDDEDDESVDRQPKSGAKDKETGS
ncbi:MAG: hypothetical protein WCF57_04485 [Pyrinomonadaceae bacterium]